MKLSIEYIKSDYLILIIKLVIIIIFIATIVGGFNGAYNFSFFNIEPNSGLVTYLKIITETTFFRPTLILLIPFVGIFINNKMGWILITSFLYYILSSIIFSLKFEELVDITDTFLFITITVIILLIISIMNIKKISNFKYGITKSELISNNIISSVIGISLTILVLIIRT